MHSHVGLSDALIPIKRFRFMCVRLKECAQRRAQELQDTGSNSYESVAAEKRRIRWTL